LCACFLILRQPDAQCAGSPCARGKKSVAHNVGCKCVAAQVTCPAPMHSPKELRCKQCLKITFLRKGTRVITVISFRLLLFVVKQLPTLSLLIEQPNHFPTNLTKRLNSSILLLSEPDTRRTLCLGLSQVGMPRIWFGLVHCMHLWSVPARSCPSRCWWGCCYREHGTIGCTRFAGGNSSTVLDTRPHSKGFERPSATMGSGAGSGK
jgi:hypothetical protein